MTPEATETLDRLKSTFPGCVGVYTDEGLIVVRRPSADEAMELEDAVGSLTDLSSKPSPYAGLEEIKRLVVHPSADRTEEILQSYAESFQQLLGMARTAAWAGDPPRLREATLKDEELYDRAQKPDGQGRYPRRAGGRIFAVEHVKSVERLAAEFEEWAQMTPAERAARPESNPNVPLEVVVGRYLMRRLGLIEHRELQREIAARGFLVRTRNGEERIPRSSTLARIARSHVVEPLAPGCAVPDWEAHPYLLIMLGRVVRDRSALSAGNSEGKS